MPSRRVCSILALLALSPVGLAQVDHPAPGQPPARQQINPAIPNQQPETKPEAPKKKARPAIYEEKADARVQIAAAMKAAGRENRRVLIQWGGNWCGWCHLLHDTFKKDPAIAKELLYEYDVVLVDAGVPDGKNLDLAKVYKADLETHGYPYLTILDPAGNVIANQETGELERKGSDGKVSDPPGHDAEKVLAFLKKNHAKPRPADVMLKEAREAAKASGKKVFLHFGAPWCGWCKKLDAWLVREDVAPVFTKDFVDLKIDIDRMPGGKEIQTQYDKNAGRSGIPWFAIIDAATGEAIATSDGPKGNVGFPATDEEIAHFVTMLKGARNKISDSDIQTLKVTLEEGRKKESGER